MKQFLAILFLCSLSFVTMASHEPWVTIEYPQDKQKWWWDDAWWDKGFIDGLENHDVIMEEITYNNGDTDVPAYVFRPKKPGKYLAVLFQHGRRGLDDLTLKIPRRIAARGFIVLAPDVWSARFIEKYPMEHDYEVEGDVAKGFEVLLKLKDVKGKKACAISHTRGGYMTLKALTKHKAQEKNVACYISYYPHWQDPNAPEPMQVYRYANEINDLKVPVMVFIGEHDQYQRVRSISEGIKTLEEKGRKPKFIVYPGVGRGFDFRPSNVRMFADDLAAKDAMRRAEIFVREHLK
ncbi:MAG: dienelactone hydrolase family protein [Gammaproteobacteria bacterium]|nr:dienelactone hydrolase family protein [Gammaproteobacteria bacterium]MDH5731583.1 dienelactone hydrolase family protein [Gammaproteobacteria bacterium]